MFASSRLRAELRSGVALQDMHLTLVLGRIASRAGISGGIHGAIIVNQFHSILSNARLKMVGHHFLQSLQPSGEVPRAETPIIDFLFLPIRWGDSATV